MNKLFLFVVLIVFSLSGQEVPLRVGMDLEFCSNTGFVMPSNGSFDGYDVRIACLIARSLERPLMIVDTKFSELIQNLKDGNIDLIISQMFRTSNRLMEIEQIPYTYQGTLDFFNLILRENDILSGDKSDFLMQINDSASATNKETIAVIEGAAQEEYLDFRINGGLSNLEKRVFQNCDEVINELSNNNVRGFLFGVFTNEFVETNFDDIKSLQTSIISGATQVQTISIGVQRDDCDLIKNVFDVIDLKNNTGELMTLANQFVPGSILTNNLLQFSPQDPDCTLN